MHMQHHMKVKMKEYLSEFVNKDMFYIFMKSSSWWNDEY